MDKIDIRYKDTGYNRYLIQERMDILDVWYKR